MNARVFINDVLIGSTGKFDRNISNALSRVASQPYYFLIPSALLKKDENTLKNTGECQRFRKWVARKNLFGGK